MEIESKYSRSYISSFFFFNSVNVKYKITDNVIKHYIFILIRNRVEMSLGIWRVTEARYLKLQACQSAYLKALYYVPRYFTVTFK